jgi:hypothetical protein
LILKLDRWIIYGDCLVGYIYDSPNFSKGSRVKTGAIRFVDLPNLTAECLDGKYVLCEPGTNEEHQLPGFGVKPLIEVPKIDTSIFLNPKG